MKKLIFALCAWFLLANFVFADFADTNNSKFATAIEFYRDKGVLKGYEGNVYRPNELVDRAAFVKVVITSKFKNQVRGSNCFKDVKNEWFAPHICTASKLNLISGYDDGNFGPERTIMLSEALKIVIEAYSFDVEDLEGEWYKKYFEFANKHNLLTGIQGSAESLLSRGQLAQLLYNVERYALQSSGQLGLAIVKEARAQIGKVTSYDTGYYSGGYPPEDTGACTDAVERALFRVGYDIKTKIDLDMRRNSSRYPHTSDVNINFRRVRNVKVFLDYNAQVLPIDIDLSRPETFDSWQPGDIVTYDQIEGGLWHIAIISDKKAANGVPLLIHNFGKGVKENNLLLDWPAPITGHYRIEL